MAGCPEGRVAVQNECWLLSTADWCARCVGGVSAALSFGVCCLNGGEERDEGALHML